MPFGIMNHWEDSGTMPIFCLEHHINLDNEGKQFTVDSILIVYLFKNMDH